ncbi:hypothetical protein [Actinomadura sp. NPDC048394]|uniref:hypothetical protein n=1 Tax=Actinomadura sp. NPDC048394 TaxID=3158223 RepID=UPI0033C9922F
MGLLDAVHIALALAALAMVVDALRLRRRIGGLRRLPPVRALHVLDGYRPLVAAGVEVPEDVRRAAASYARERGLGLLDLVPADLPVLQALDLARHAHFEDPSGSGRGAGYALLVAEAVPARSRIDDADLAMLAARLRPDAAPAETVVARVGGRALPPRRRTVRAELAWCGVIVAGLLAEPWMGALLGLLYCALPYATFAGTAIRPRDLHVLRLVRTPAELWRAAAPRRRRLRA